MVDRITNENLERLCAIINKETGSPLEMFNRGGKNRSAMNVNHFHVDHAYGGVKLCRITSAEGGEINVLQTGYLAKRDLYELMHAFLRGYRLAKEGK